MIIFDASYLIVYLHPNPEPAKDRNDKPVSRFRDRVEYLIASLSGADQVIGIPAPALAEVMVRAGKGRFKYLNILSDSYRFEIIPFGTKAAIEAGELIAQIKNQNKSQPWATWAKLKFDVQIASIGKAEEVTAFYSDDKDVEAHGKRLKLKVIRICDLDLPPAPDPKEVAEEEARRKSGLLFPPPESEVDIEEVKSDETKKAEQPTGAENPPELRADVTRGIGDPTGKAEVGKNEKGEVAEEKAIEKPKPTAKGGLGEGGP